MISPFGEKTPKIADTAFIASDAIVIGDVEIGENASVWFGSIVRGDVNLSASATARIFRMRRLFT